MEGRLGGLTLAFLARHGRLYESSMEDRGGKEYPWEMGRRRMRWTPMMKWNGCVRCWWPCSLRSALLASRTHSTHTSGSIPLLSRLVNSIILLTLSLTSVVLAWVAHVFRRHRKSGRSLFASAVTSLVLNRSLDGATIDTHTHKYLVVFELLADRSIARSLLVTTPPDSALPY